METRKSVQTARLAYPIELLFGCPYVSRLLEQGRLSFRAVARRAFFMGLGFSILPAGLLILMREYTLAVAIALTAGLTAAFASACFYIISGLGQRQGDSCVIV